MMHHIQQQVRAVQSRQQRQWVWQCASAGLLIGGASGCALSCLRLLTRSSFSWIWVGMLVAIPAIIGVTVAFARSRSQQFAAKQIDQSCNLKDRIQTALQFLESSPVDSLRRLQIADAEEQIRSMNPASVAPIMAPQFWSWGLFLSVVAMLLATITHRPSPLMASVITNSVVTEQASRAATAMEEVEEFQKEQNDPELEKMLSEMNKQIQALTLPGVEPKEALARLSEMEASVQEMQQQLSDASAEKQLKEIGEALSLADATAAAGEALSQGDMQKAADELSKMEMPQLDRKTEKAVSEKLKQAAKNAAEQTKQSRIKEAMDKIQEGMSTGEKSKFEEGAKGLAGECEKQAQKKKLSELLNKQAQALGECKAECEGEAKAQAQARAQGPNKGGNKAGKGSPGDSQGEKTAKQKTGKEMKITGQDSGTGEVDTETTTSPEQEQEAVREYRKNAGKYEAMQESALETESIPLGHRQTIRRYFELIRPQGTEADSIDAASPAAPQ